MPKTTFFSLNQWNRFIFLLIAALPISLSCEEGLPLYYWQQQKFVNFGDYLSLKIVERIVGGPVKVFIRHPKNKDKKLLALGSLMSFAADGDVIWGTGVNGKLPKKESYAFTHLDVRAVRGPLTRQFLKETFQIDAPEIYGDPALLIPYLFPEFKRSENPSYDFIIIPHYSELHFFPKEIFPNAVYATDPWDEVIRKICDSRFVISSSLHGIIVAEAFGIPARMLRITETEPLFKYFDYYAGTNRLDFQFAYSVEEALMMGGEKPFECDLMKLYSAFPFEFWPNTRFEYPALEGVAKLLCPEKMMILRPFLSDSLAATCHSTRPPPSGSDKEEWAQFVRKGTSPALHCQDPPDLLVCPQPQKGNFNGPMSFAIPSLTN